MHSVLLARLYWTSDLQSEESKAECPAAGGKQAFLTNSVWTPEHMQVTGSLKATQQAGSKIYTALPCRHTLMLKQHTSRGAFVGFGAANIFTTSHSERHILLQLQSQMPECVPLLKKHIALPPGACLFHCATLKLGVQHNLLLPISFRTSRCFSSIQTP